MVRLAHRRAGVLRDDRPPEWIADGVRAHDPPTGGLRGPVRGPGAGDRLHRLDGPLVVARAVADVGPAGLEVLEVAARRNLFVLVLAGQPYFEVVGLGRAEPKVARR